ncbi:MAG: hypothetical protein FWD66_01135 [Paludibacter sp.]|nr:hypothetical protein [Paludibacter sp.]
MEIEERKRDLKPYITILSTVVLSIISAYFAVWTQLTSLRTEVEILKVKTEQLTKTTEKNTEMFKEINEKLHSIQTTLSTKADKHFTD